MTLVAGNFSTISFIYSKIIQIKKKERKVKKLKRSLYCNKYSCHFFKSNIICTTPKINHITYVKTSVKMYSGLTNSRVKHKHIG